MNVKSVASVVVLIGWLAIALGCRASAPAGANGQNAVSEFVQLEERLLSAESVWFDYHVTAEGVLEADIKGAFLLRHGDLALISGSGSISGNSVDLELRADKHGLVMRNGLGSRRVSRPSGLDEALLIGFTRMGILHNLAQLTELNPPDHAEGGVGEWVVVSGVRSEQHQAVTNFFDLLVAGQPVGSASLEIDMEGLPVMRSQSVQFPSGEMRVLERYSGMKILD
jgi:hypothetical protein